MTTLAGTGLGGLISFALSRMQFFEARRERAEERRQLKDQASRDRRLSCYSEFLTRARRYRNLVREISAGIDAPIDASKFDELAASADAASSMVFLVVESPAVFDSCRSILRVIGECQSYIHATPGSLESSPQEIVDRLAYALRKFQATSRVELEIAGVSSAHILGGYMKRADEVESGIGQGS